MKEKFLKWLKRSGKKLIIWAAVIAAAAVGFIYEGTLHSEGSIKSFIKDNQQAYYEAAEALLDKPTLSGDPDSGRLEDHVNSDNKISLETLYGNPSYKESRSKLEAIANLGTQDVRSDGKSVRFYQKDRFVIIYSPDGDGVSDAEEYGNGWYYIASY